MGRKLYVGNLPYETNEQDLQELFAQAGLDAHAQGYPEASRGEFAGARRTFVPGHVGEGAGIEGHGGPFDRRRDLAFDGAPGTEQHEVRDGHRVAVHDGARRRSAQHEEQRRMTGRYGAAAQMRHHAARRAVR